MRESGDVVFDDSVGHKMWLDLMELGVSIIHAVEEEMVGCLGPVSSTNLLAVFFLGHN